MTLARPCFRNIPPPENMATAVTQGCDHLAYDTDDGGCASPSRCNEQFLRQSAPAMDRTMRSGKKYGDIAPMPAQ
jgi:hypothetical protein